MLIEVTVEQRNGAFFIEEDSRRLAEMTFTLPSPGKMIIHHTEVSDKLRGQHIGNQLVEKAVHYARENKLKITPLCPFANAIFKKKPEYSDVLFKP